MPLHRDRALVKNLSREGLPMLFPRGVARAGGPLPLPTRASPEEVNAPPSDSAPKPATPRGISSSAAS